MSPTTALLLFAGVLAAPIAIAVGLVTTNEAKVLGAVIGLICLFVILSNSFYGLLFFVGLLYTRPEETIPALDGMHLPLIIAIVALVSMLARMGINKEPFVKTPLNTMILGFFVVAVASSVQNDNIAAAAQDIGRLVIIVVLILNLIRSPEQYRKMITAVLFFSGYLALFSIYLFHAGGAIGDQGTLRSEATGIFSDPNDLAATISAGLALTLSRLPTSTGWRRLLYLLLAGALVWAIVLTNSRGGTLALLAVVGGFFFSFQKRKALAVTLILLAAGIFLAVGPSRMTHFDSHEASANSRFWFWDNGYLVMAEHPALGIGYGGFPAVNNNMTAHNSFVLCYAELGLLGFFFWMGCLYYCFKRKPKTEEAGDTVGWTRGRTQRPETHPDASSIAAEKIAAMDLLGARLALAGYLVASFWLSHTYSPILYILIGLPVVAQLTAQNGQSVQSSVQPKRTGDWFAIAGMCAVTIAVIEAMARHNM